LILEDLEHKLLSGGVIKIDNVPTYKVTLQDMVDYGFTEMQNIIALMASDDKYASSFLQNIDDIVSTYYVLAIGIIQELNQVNSGVKSNLILYNSAISFLSLFFRQDVYFDQNSGFIVKDKEGNIIFILNENNYSQFREIIRHRNCLSTFSGVESENPANEMAAKLLEKKRMLNEKIRKSKSKSEDGELTMADLISIFAEDKNMPLQDVYRNYDIYQFNNQFNRLKIMNDYQVNIRALLAGAKSEDIKLQHWLSKIKNNEQ
jgi:hypothetical protein